MLLPESLLDADRSQLFTDWGTPALYRRISRTLNPAQQTLTESYVDTPISVLFDAQPVAAATTTSATDSRTQYTLLVQSAELPGNRPSLTDRLVWNDVEHQVLTATQSPDARTWRMTVLQIPTTSPSS